MTIDPFSYDNAVGQLNDMTQRNHEMAQGVQDWNNKIQEEYNSAKGSESVHDDATYVKDLMGNVVGASGLNSAYKNRKATLIKNAKARLAEITPQAEEAPASSLTPPSPYETASVDNPANPSNAYKYYELGKPAPNSQVVDMYNTKTTDISGADTPAPDSVSGESTLGYRNGGTAGEVDELKTTIGADKKQETTLLGHALGKISGGALGEDAAETLGKVGGAVTNGTLGGIDLVDGLDNIAHGKSFFKAGTSGTDEASKDLQMVAGVSDVVGLIPGLEWVAALGNIAGVAGGVAGMFGDHTKNVQHDSNVEAIKGGLKTAPSSVAEGGEVGAVAQSTLAY